MKLLANENFPKASVLALRRKGYSAILVAGLSKVSMPFLGGTLISQSLITIPVVTNAEGKATIPLIWPALPPGTIAYFQLFIQDPTAPFGYSISNGAFRLKVSRWRILPWDFRRPGRHRVYGAIL